MGLKKERWAFLFFLRKRIRTYCVVLNKYGPVIAHPWAHDSFLPFRLQAVSVPALVRLAHLFIHSEMLRQKYAQEIERSMLRSDSGI